MTPDEVVPEKAPEDMTIEEKLDIERKRAMLYQSLCEHMMMDTTKVVNPIKSDEVLVIVTRDKDALSKMDYTMKKMDQHMDEKLIIALDGSLQEVYVCRKDQVAYTRGKRVIVLNKEAIHAEDPPSDPLPGEVHPVPASTPPPTVSNPTLTEIKRV